MPLLWHDTFYNLSQFEETNIDRLPAIEDIKASNKRLGKLAEELFSFWIKQQSKYTIVFENLQIIDHKQTLGELDICLHDASTQSNIHIELITKFYLYNPEYDCNSIEAWIGPNRNDSLKNKISKLSSKQLPLLHNPISLKKLAELKLDTEHLKQQVCFKAWLFVPLNFNEKLIQFNHECIAGHYLTYEIFKKRHSALNQYFCPTKQDWLRFPESQTEWQTFSAVAPQIQLFMEAEQAIMVWIKNEETFERNIVVPFKKF